MPFCKKHPKTELVIRQGKRNQNFVVCPECKPDPGKGTGSPKPAEPAAAAAAEKKNEPTGKSFWDRPLF